MKIVKFIGGNIYKPGFNIMFGGTPMTIYCYLKAFLNDPEYKVIAIDRSVFSQNDIKFKEQLLNFKKGSNILHVDDTSILERMYHCKLPAPDIVGPIARSPLKIYKGGGKVRYPAAWFYKAKVIRLNYAEERKNRDLVNIISHGVDIEILKPAYQLKDIGITDRRYILWAGQHQRPAKNYPMFEDIKRITKLPKPYEFIVMSRYNVCDYWKMLDRTAMVINTSKYESFCCALFEAKAKGVTTLQRKELHGQGIHQLSEIQVEYTPEAYRDKILEVIKNNQIENYGIKNRAYVEEFATLKHMRDSIAKIYKEINR